MFFRLSKSGQIGVQNRIDDAACAQRVGAGRRPSSSIKWRWPRLSLGRAKTEENVIKYEFKMRNDYKMISNSPQFLGSLAIGSIYPNVERAAGSQLRRPKEGHTPTTYVGRS